MHSRYLISDCGMQLVNPVLGASKSEFFDEIYSVIVGRIVSIRFRLRPRIH